MVLGSILLLIGLNLHAQTSLPTDLKEAAKYISQQLRDPKLTPDTCTNELKVLGDQIYHLKPDHFKVESGLKASSNGEDTISILFRARLTLHQRFQKWVAGSEFSSLEKLEECSRQVRAMHRTLRGMEDLWGLNALYKDKKLNNKDSQGKTIQKRPLTDNEWPYLMVNRDANGGKANFSLDMIQHGDVLLSRGTTFTGAIISRIGAVDNQFSHLAIAYKDDGTLFGDYGKGKLFAVESVLNNGLQIVPLDEYVMDGKTRLSIYRYVNITSQKVSAPSQVVAEGARYLASLATPLGEELTKVWKGSVPKVCYNFTMDMEDRKCMFCSQAVAIAINHACESKGITCETFKHYERPGRTSFPLIWAQFDGTKNPLVKMLEVVVNESFAPADVEVEPRLTLVAEWRDYTTVSTARIYDMILSKLFQYMENHGYQFSEIDSVDTLAAVGEKLVKQIDKMPENTPLGFVKGSVLMGFLMKHTGPGDTIAEQVPKMAPAEVKSMLVQFGVEPKKAEALADRAGEILKRILRHVGLTTRLENLTQENLKVKGRFLTDQQLDFAMDLIRNKDCERFQMGGAGVMYHDILRRPGAKDVACDNAITPLSDSW